MHNVFISYHHANDWQYRDACNYPNTTTLIKE